MRIIIITQNDPFYLADCLNYLFKNMPEYVEVAGCVVSDVSPFGKKENFLKKSIKTVRIFGPRFFVRYAVRYILSKVNPEKSVLKIIGRYNIKQIILNGSINDATSLDRLRAENPDLLISIAGNEIFKADLIKLAPKGCLNLHTALLPKYRGLMPSFWALKNNESETGVSVFYVDEGIDSGPIIIQKRIKIGSASLEKLIKETKLLGMDAILESIEAIKNDDVVLIDNNDDEKSYYTFPTKHDVSDFIKSGKKFY